MKKLLSLLTALLFVGTMWGDPVAATMTPGSNSQNCTLNTKAGVKCGTGQKDGSVAIGVGSGATKLTFYVALWNGTSGNLSVSASTGVTVSSATISPSANAGISGNSPYTLSEGSNEEDYKIELTLTGVNTNATITVASGTARRFVIWSATYEAVPQVPSVSVDPSPVAFGNVKQHTRGPLDSEYIFESFTVTGANLENNITVNKPAGSIFALWNPETEMQINSIELTPDANGNVEKELAIMAATGWSGAQNGSFTISGTDLAEDSVINITMNVTPTFEVGVDVNDDEMGTATINGQSAVYTDGVDVLNIVASPKPGYEFVNWTVSDGEVLGVADATSATTTVNKATAAGTITANFQAQACTNLAAPTLDEGNTQVTYEYANLAWTAVANAETYAFVVTKHGESTPHVSSSTGNTSTMILNLDANTQYDYSVMAKGDGSTYCDENNPLLVGSFTTDPMPSATLTLSENGIERAFAGSHKLKDVVTLPTETETGVVGKVLVGWSTVAVAETDTKPTVNYYDKGAEYTLSATSQKLYAVYATETPGTPSLTKMVTGNTLANGDKIVVVANETQYGLYQEDNGSSYVRNWSFEGTDPVVSELSDAKKIWDVTTGSASGKWKLGDATNGYLNNTSSTNISVDNTGSDWALTDLGNGTFNLTSTQKLSCRTDLSSANANLWRGAGNGGTSGTPELILYKYFEGETSYSGYTTVGVRKLADPVFTPAGGTYTSAQNITISAAEGTIYYTLDGTDPTDESTEYTGAIALDTYGEHTIKAIAIGGSGNQSEVVSASYTLKVPFTSFTELVTKLGKTTTNDITVTFSDVVITGFYSNGSSEKKGVYLNVKDADGTNDIEIYYNGESVVVPSTWVAEGKLAGTITGNWTAWKGQWEIVPTTDGWNWTDLNYTDKPTALEDVETSVKAVKVLRNGILLIEKNGHTYNAMGLLIK